MSVFLDQLKEKLIVAQKRMQDAAVRLQLAQAEHAAATNEYNTWNFAVHVETPRAAAEDAENSSAPALTAGSVITVKAEEPVSVGNSAAGEINKTELVRNVLRQHGTAMRPVEVWHALKEQIPQRGYVYAILGRLKSRDQVIWKGGKYRFRVPPKLEEAKPVTTVQ